MVGATRLAAAQSLGWDEIECFISDCGEIDAELWEIAENLHRADLTKEQRDRHIRRFAELLAAKENEEKHGQVVHLSTVGGRGNKGIARKVAEQTGVSAKTVKRALAPQPPPAVKPAAVPLSEEDACERQVASLMAAWNKADTDD